MAESTNAKRQPFDPGEPLLRRVANDPTAGGWATWAKKLLAGDGPPARSRKRRPRKRAAANRAR